MTEYQERRLNILNNKIEKEQKIKGNFKNKFKTICFSLLLFSATIVALGFINDPLLLDSPETYNYLPLLAYTIIIFIILMSMALLIQLMFVIHCNFLIKMYEKEEKTLLDIIEKNRLDFERFENFDEIGDEEK